MTFAPDLGDRINGGYKDPNMFTARLVFQLVTMFQGVILGMMSLSLLFAAACRTDGTH